jgi:hypothetical protein
MGIANVKSVVATRKVSRCRNKKHSSSIGAKKKFFSYVD